MGECDRSGAFSGAKWCDVWVSDWTGMGKTAFGGGIFIVCDSDERLYDMGQGDIVGVSGVVPGKSGDFYRAGIFKFAGGKFSRHTDGYK